MFVGDFQTVVLKAFSRLWSQQEVIFPTINPSSVNTQVFKMLSQILRKPCPAINIARDEDRYYENVII